ncbi:hypothetical protein SAMD00023378_0585 [Ralstonia sp. NT80]|nr:hypothetical protein SAMD00023378_0585 [Ralstonia sp. NT80]
MLLSVLGVLGNEAARIVMALRTLGIAVPPMIHTHIEAERHDLATNGQRMASEAIKGEA